MNEVATTGHLDTHQVLLLFWHSHLPLVFVGWQGMPFQVILKILGLETVMGFNKIGDNLSLFGLKFAARSMV